jgi:hypothetical protein
MAENKRVTQADKEQNIKEELIKLYVRIENFGLNTKEANLLNNRITYFRGKYYNYPF